jgi:type I restriction enzyme S subunit
MDGHECSEVLFSEIKNDNEKYRFDSEFFQKRFLKAYEKIKGQPHSTIKKEYSCLTDFHANGSYEHIAKNYKLLNNKDYAYMVRTTDLEANDFVNDVKYVSKSTYEFLSKSKVFGGEVLINKIGSPGRSYLMPKLNMPVSLGMNLFMIRLKDNATIDATTLWLYLNTNIGSTIVKRKINGTVPLTIDKAAIKSIYTPCFSKVFRNFLIMMVEAAGKKNEHSKELYTQAESILKNILKIDQKNTSNISVKNVTESFLVSGRLDAEYYQPKYDRLFASLKNHPTQLLGGKDGIVTIKKSIEPGSDLYCDDGIPFVRVSDVTKYGISETSIKLPRNIVEEPNKLYPKKNTILFSKDGSVGIAYKVEKDMEVITSGALLHLIVKKPLEVLPDYLTLVLNSPIVQLQAERDSNGAIIKHWKPSEIENVIIPILDIEIQKEIVSKIQESFKLRRQSEQLLEKAKQAVELAIEQGEEKTIEWMKDKVK